ncbi:hypothetical protein, partial [Dokdonella sp.]|uniref:hypothetical protein n=1 Tax=Dokdonella sp. TaxID=2291710 RepID=UPI003C6088B7
VEHGLRDDMMRFILILLGLLASATPAAADEHFYAYDPVSSSARLLTRGITLQVERGLFGRTRVMRLYATAGAGSAGLERESLPDTRLRAALPAGAEESNAYRVEAEGTGGALARVMCPGAGQVWLVFGRVRPLRDITVQAVGQGQDGQLRHCQTLQYRYRGEWSRPEDHSLREGGASPSPLG